MEQKLSLIVFRHGETTFNRDRIFSGWIDIWLDNQGIREAKQLGKKLSKEKIDLAFCSDMLRSKQTLIHVLRYHPNSKIIIDHRIKERNYGVFSGHSKDAFKKTLPKKYEEIHRGYYADIPKGENFEMVGKRVFPFMTELIKMMETEKVNVAISAHPSSMRLILEYLEGLSPEQVEKLEFSPTTYKKYVIRFNSPN
jgi:broad specificity phosphatase PhoE